MVQRQQHHRNRLIRRRVASPETARVKEGLGDRPQALRTLPLGRCTAEPQPLLERREGVEAVRDVGERAGAVIAAAVAVGGVAGGVVDGGEAGVDGDRVDVREQDVGAGAVGCEVEVGAVEAERGGVVGVELLEVRVGGRGCGEWVALPVGLVARVVEEERGMGEERRDLRGYGGEVLVGPAHVVHDE